MKTVRKIIQDYKVDCPKWLPDNVAYSTIMGSYTYGVKKETSDLDIYGFVIPPKRILFPHLSGEINGFGHPKERFSCFLKHNINIENEQKEVIYDVTLYNIVNFLNMCMQNNPNVIETLFTPYYAVNETTKVGTLVRDNRNLFLSKNVWYTFKGYAYQSLKKLQNKERCHPKRKSDIEKFGYCTKFAYHVVRLLLEVEEIIEFGTLTLDKNSEILKEIRAGKWLEEDIIKFFSDKEKILEEKYKKTALPDKVDENKVYNLLVDCLEIQYGNLKDCLFIPNR